MWQAQCVADVVKQQRMSGLCEKPDTACTCEGILNIVLYL